MVMSARTMIDMYCGLLVRSLARSHGTPLPATLAQSDVSLPHETAPPAIFASSTKPHQTNASAATSRLTRGRARVVGIVSLFGSATPQR
jgi:hypothetical protein